RHALAEVEADRDRRELALVADRERTDRRAGPARKGRQRYLLAGARRTHVDLVQRVGAALQLGQDFQDHAIGVELGKILRDLALAERVVERIVDQLRGDAVARGGVAVDLKLDRRALRLLVGGDVAQLRQRLHLGEDLRRPLVELGEVGVLQREFELGAGGTAAETDVLRRLHIEAGAFHLLELGTQPRDDVLGGGLALAAWLQRDPHAAVVAGAAGAADRHRGGRDVGIRENDLRQRFLTVPHRLEGDVLGGFRCRGDQAVVLLREEALRDDYEQVDRQAERREEDQERGPPPAQGEIEPALVAAQH